MRGKRNAHTVFVSKPEGNRPLGRPRHKWENSIQMDIKIKMGGHGLDPSDSGQGQAASYKHGNEPSSTTQCRKLLD